MLKLNKKVLNLEMKNRVAFALMALLLIFGLFSQVSLPSHTQGDVLPDYSKHLSEISYDQLDWKKKDDAFWKEVLTSEQFRVCRKGGTERAFSGAYNSLKKEGKFLCSSCGIPLFDSRHKFDSGTGWPSFDRPISSDVVGLKSDYSLGMSRTEVVCANCDAHLGHVFNDGPARTTGKRYCINSVCLLYVGGGG